MLALKLLLLISSLCTVGVRACSPTQMSTLELGCVTPLVNATAYAVQIGVDPTTATNQATGVGFVNTITGAQMALLTISDNDDASPSLYTSTGAIELLSDAGPNYLNITADGCLYFNNVLLACSNGTTPEGAPAEPSTDASIANWKLTIYIVTAITITFMIACPLGMFIQKKRMRAHTVGTTTAYGAVEDITEH